MSPRNVIR